MNRHAALVTMCCMSWFGTWITSAMTAENIADPIFNLKAICDDPLDAKVLKSRQWTPDANPHDPLETKVFAAAMAKTVVIEEIEYTVEILAGKPVRIFGILAYPKDGKNLPAIFWSQGGMYAAGPYWPRLWAAKGYFCLNVTLPHDVYNSFARFTTENPADGNLTRLAVAQMRGITYLAQRREVDAQRIGIGGTSYGGLFATLIAGADPRVKAGLTFFTSGNHQLGTNYPQFNRLRTTDEVGIWMGTIDPAWRLKRRAVPMLWGVAANDHWMHLPAACRTFQDSIGEKRLAIAPNWYHAFPANIDQELLDWFDIYLAKTRKPYNLPSAIEVKTTADGKLAARWSWTGENPVRKAELIVAYGRTRPWHDGWLFRYHHAIAAKVEADSAAAEIPLPEEGLECMVYGNVTDDNDMVVSTLPLALSADDVGGVKATPLKLNTALVSDFSEEEMTFVRRHGEPIAGKIDRSQAQAGQQSLRVEPASGKAQPRVGLKLGHIPGHSHRLSLWLRASQHVQVKVSVTSDPPSNWSIPIVDTLRRQYPDSPNVAGADIRPVVYRMDAAAGPSWREFSLDCPTDATPVEGYRLHITAESAIATYWIDSIRFEPQWRRK